MQTPSTIFLIGFMGAGKTTWGKRIAHQLGYTHTDLDTEMEKLSGQTIAELIEMEGEKAFRERERDTLRTLQTFQSIISTGGGTACYFDNILWMKQHGIVVYLDVNEGVLYQRLSQPKSADRPLLRGLKGEELRHYIHTKLQQRLPYYQQADIHWDPVHDSLDTLLARLKMSVP